MSTATALVARVTPTEAPVRRSLTVDGHPLEIAHLDWTKAPLDVSLEPATVERIRECHRFMLDCLADGRPIYGATTGFGPLVVFPGREDATEQCQNALAHLTAGQGPDMETEVVRATMLVRLWSLSQARSGVSTHVVEAMAAALGTSFTPAVPRLGSLGASGDLIPLSYVARALEGHGHAYFDEDRMAAADALRLAGLKPLRLDGRDALALVNGTSVTAAAGGLAVASLTRSRTVAVHLSALLADLLGCSPAYLGAELLEAFNHPETARIGTLMRDRLAGTVPSGTRALQEPYSIRCTPQLIGAADSALSYAEQVVRRDLQGVSDNPLFFPEKDLVAHGGNFFGQPVAFAADLMSLAATQLGNLAERQLDLLIDPHRNGGLPPMLAADAGRQHALQGVQLAATAIVAAMRRAATPASIQSLPTNGHNQDVIPFGTQAALNALDQARLLRLLHGSLAVALRQAAHVGDRRPTAPACAELMDRLIELLPPVDPDRPLDEEVRKAADLLDTVAETK